MGFGKSVSLHSRNNCSLLLDMGFGKSVSLHSRNNCSLLLRKYEGCQLFKFSIFNFFNIVNFFCTLLYSRLRFDFMLSQIKFQLLPKL